jgi:hypothetical protein
MDNEAIPPQIRRELVDEDEVIIDDTKRQFKRQFTRLVTEDTNNHNAPTSDCVPLRGAPLDKPRVGPTGTRCVISEWRRLNQLDLKSGEYTLLLNTLLDNEVDRNATTSLEGEDATVVLEILAEVRIDLHPARS